MPTYHYKCSEEQCQHVFYTFQSMKDENLKECPVCENSSLRRIIHAAQGFVKGEPKTIGALAEENTNRLSNSQREDMWARNDERKILARQAAKEELEKKLPKGAYIK